MYSKNEIKTFSWLRATSCHKTLVLDSPYLSAVKKGGRGRNEEVVDENREPFQRVVVLLRDRALFEGCIR